MLDISNNLFGLISITKIPKNGPFLIKLTQKSSKMDKNDFPHRFLRVRHKRNYKKCIPNESF